VAGDEEKKDGNTEFTERRTQSAQRKAQRRIGEEVEYVPRSLHCATAESAVAPVGMTKWMQFSGALGRGGTGLKIVSSTRKRRSDGFV